MRVRRRARHGVEPVCSPRWARARSCCRNQRTADAPLCVWGGWWQGQQLQTHTTIKTLDMVGGSSFAAEFRR